MEQVRVLPKKATEEKFNELHNLVTEDFLQRVRSGQATTQDLKACLLYTSPSPRDQRGSRMPSSA